LTIGGKEGLSHVLGIALGPDHHLYVTQWRVPSVTVFNVAGAQVRTIGRQGSGPGEFVFATAVGWKGDTLWVSDPPQSRINLFDRSGRFVSSVTFTTRPPSPAYRNLSPGAVLADGSILSIAAPARSDVLTAGRVLRVPVLRMTRAGHVIDTIATTAPLIMATRLELAPNRGFTVANPMTSQPIVAPTAGGAGVVIVERGASSDRRRAAFRVTRLTLEGDTVFSREYAYQPIAVSGSYRARVYAEIVNNVAASERQIPRSRIEEVVAKGLPLPAFHPPVSAFVAGSDGSLWLRREETESQSVSWDVLNAAGAPLGTLSAAAGLTFALANLEVVWAVVTDSLDVSAIQRLRVIRPGR
jgi:hypothetical protein